MVSDGAGVGLSCVFLFLGLGVRPSCVWWLDSLPLRWVCGWVSVVVIDGVIYAAMSCVGCAVVAGVVLLVVRLGDLLTY
jgi:hypothetical protein